MAGFQKVSGQCLFAHPRVSRPLGDQLFQVRRVHGSRAQRIAGDVVLGAFQGHHLGQPDQAMLGRHIVAAVGRSLDAVNGCQVDDAAPIARFHARHQAVHEVVGRTQIHRQRIRPFVGGEVFNGRIVARHCVVDQDVNVAIQPLGGQDHGINLLGFGDVCTVVVGLGTGVAQHLQLVLDQSILTKAIDQHVAAFAGQGRSDFKTNAPQRAGDQGRFSLEHGRLSE